MQELPNTLKSGKTKRELITLVRDEGMSITAAAALLGIPRKTCADFLNQRTHLNFWEKYEAPVREEIPDLSDVKKSDYVPLNEIDFKELERKLTKIVETQNLKNSKKLKIVVIADTQCKPNESLEYMQWIGKYIADKKPDIIVHIGDNYDFPSLSSYDKGKKSFEGRRLKADIEAGNRGLELLVSEFKCAGYNPRMVFCMGNHEDRFDRLKNDMPELDGFVGTALLPLADMGWEVHPFLKPVEIEDIYFVHYLANPFTGKPYAGTALNQLKTVGKSFVVGHKQCLDIAIRPTIDGKHQIGIVNGAAYDFHEAYKGHSGNNHFRGIIMLHEVSDGFGLPMPVSLNYLKERYAKNLSEN